MSFKTFYEGENMKPTEEMKEWFKERTNRHINLVQKYAKILENYNPKRFECLVDRCIEHDASKFNEPEYTPYCFISWDYHCKDLGKEFNVPQDIKDDMNKATEHHVHSNRHHAEFFDDTSKINREDRDKKPDKMVDATEMEDMDIFEMLCDWAGMAEEKNNSIKSWANKNVNIRWQFTEEQTKLIYDIIDILESLEEGK